jgi:hypothetical protein
MPRRTQSKLPAEVKRLQDQIEQWRRTRERRTAMPAALWSDAVTLCKSAGAYQVARALRINFEGLKRRMAEAGRGGTASAVPGTFVELTGAQILGASSGTVVEVEDEGGRRLVVRLAKEAHVDVAQLVSVFRRGG